MKFVIAIRKIGQNGWFQVGSARAEWLVPGWHSGSFEDLGNASVLLIWAPLYILHLI